MEKQFEILVVDDNPENLKVLSDYLKIEGYLVRVAGDGPGALKSIETASPDLVLLDVNMPGINGFEVCKKIKSDQTYKDLPVMFISALDDSFNRSMGFEAGGVDYMTKPFDIDVVKVRVKTHLLLRSCRMKIVEMEAELLEKDEKIKQLQVQLTNKS